MDEKHRNHTKTTLMSIAEEYQNKSKLVQGPVNNSRRKKSVPLDVEILPKGSRWPVPPVIRVSVKPAQKSVEVLHRFRAEWLSCSTVAEKQFAVGNHSPADSCRADWVSNCSSLTDTESDRTTGSVDSSGDSGSPGPPTPRRPTPPRPAASSSHSAHSVHARNYHVFTQKPITMNPPRGPDSDHSDNNQNLKHINRRLHDLEKRVLKQDIVFRALSPRLVDMSDRAPDGCPRRAGADGGRPQRPERPGCSYIGQYSRVPHTSAFHKCSKHTGSASSKRTIEKEHNSDQYGRAFTTCDGFTARQKRQCASVPCKRVEIPRVSDDRAHRIRSKLNPVRDYRLMDTVHYLAQGEFAPRDDGIKLTPSREAVLSDIIWEDVCRTHWPGARLNAHRESRADRPTHRRELHKLIDNMLRDRVAHLDRRKRRHYRVVKLNQQQEAFPRAIGKTGDIIVASHEDSNEHDDVSRSEHRAPGAAGPRGRVEVPRRCHRSQERVPAAGPSWRRDGPGPSAARDVAETYCVQTDHRQGPNFDRTEEPSTSARLQASGAPHAVGRESARRRPQRCAPALDRYILLPTLVVGTPSNVRRQMKFNELYHRILNNKQSQGEGPKSTDDAAAAASRDAADGVGEREARRPRVGVETKSVGLNVKMTPSPTASDH